MRNSRKQVASIAFVLIFGFVAEALFAVHSTVAGPPEDVGKGETTVGNNLSFPVIAVDGFSITPVTKSLECVYSGSNDGLTVEQLAKLGSDDWYPQPPYSCAESTNVWQAEYTDTAAPDKVDVTYIDWGDNIESVSPKVKTPFRLEVTLYKKLPNEETMTAYTMEVLENPSSSTELQGTNDEPYDSHYATVISEKPKLVIQYFGDTEPENYDHSVYRLMWIESKWGYVPDCNSDGIVDENDFDCSIYPRIKQVSFAPELNVGGKYVFGASEGGWKPDLSGWYRITFYVPREPESGVNLISAIVANASTGFTTLSEGSAATPVVDADNNLTYVDVKVLSGGGKSVR